MVLDDPAVHVSPAHFAGVTLNRRALVHDMQFLRMGDHLELVDRHDSDHRKQRAVRLPALRAAAGVVVGDIAGDADRDLVGRAFARQRTAVEAAVTWLQPVVDQRVETGCHGGKTFRERVGGRQTPDSPRQEPWHNRAEPPALRQGAASLAVARSNGKSRGAAGAAVRRPNAARGEAGRRRSRRPSIPISISRSKRSAKASMISSTRTSGAEAPAVIPRGLDVLEQLPLDVLGAQHEPRQIGQPDRSPTSLSRWEFEEFDEPTTIRASTTLARSASPPPGGSSWRSRCPPSAARRSAESARAASRPSAWCRRSKAWSA